MPHLRFTQDKRGYENTYVVHQARRRGKGRQRILYWFRTPPNVRVGRAALDEEAIRTIEECNPDIAFDWGNILEARPSPAPAEPVGRRRRPRDSRAQESTAQVPPGRARQEEREVGTLTVEEAAASHAVREAERPAPAEFVPALEQASSDTAEIPEIEPPALVPVTVYHGGADVLVAAEGAAPRPLPVEARLGSEQLSRVRARYAEILTRITQRTGSDSVRLEEMRRTAEVLNPDAWVTKQEIASGLQHFDARLGEIRRALGIKRRRRSRRGGRRRRPSRPAPGPVAPGENAGPEGVPGLPDKPDELGEDDGTP